MRRKVALILLIAAVARGAFLFARSLEASQYYTYSDRAVTACQQGDTANAYSYLKSAQQHAENSGDADLVSEGRHYQRLFDGNQCEE